MPRVPFTFWTLMNAIPVAVVATYALVAAGEYLANPPARPWDGALPFWGTLLIASTAAATWVLSSRRKSVASLSPTGAPPMPLSRVRFTVRRLMVAVAVVAVVVWPIARHWRFSRLARFHDDESLRGAIWRPNPDGSTGCYLTEKGWWHFYLVRKYDRAARYPWLPVVPDTPEPE